MKPFRSSATALVLVTATFLLNQQQAHAAASASSQISFTNLLITPSAGMVTFLTNWTVEAFAVLATIS